MRDPKKWKAACDILKEALLRPLAEDHRQAIRDEKCCYEYDEVRNEVMKELDFIREEIHSPSDLGII